MSLLMLFRFAGGPPPAPPLQPDLSFSADDALWSSSAQDRPVYAVLPSEDAPAPLQ